METIYQEVLVHNFIFIDKAAARSPHRNLGICYGLLFFTELMSRQSCNKIIFNGMRHFKPQYASLFYTIIQLF